MTCAFVLKSGNPCIAAVKSGSTYCPLHACDKCGGAGDRCWFCGGTGGKDQQYQKHQRMAQSASGTKNTSSTRRKGA